MKNINSIHVSNRDVKVVKQKWNNLKGYNCSRREARMTGGGANEAGEV